ncbi:hypothetical protein [Namhaeicola litoreus]|uniref:Uncharacterized protein n=1 Tax=Namhaeicola litoreus TaxID=1052145 RepID=A0ABW3Y1R5_9FLAO
MKYLLRIILFIVILLIAGGTIMNFINSGQGEIYIGIGVLIFAFILMPLFIYHRYKGKDLSKYSIDQYFRENKHNNPEK